MSLPAIQFQHGMKQADYKQKCLDIYYKSDVCDKTLSFGCEVFENHVRATVIKVEQGFSADGENDMVTTTACAPLTQKRWRFGDRPGYSIIGHPPTLASWWRLIKLYGDTRYESITIKDGLMTVSAPTGEAAHFVDEINGTPGTNYEWKEVTFNLTTEEPTDWQKLYEIIK